MIAPSPKLSNMQLELLKIYSKNLPEEQLLEIKHLLSEYFAKKIVEEADRVWLERGYTDEYMERLLNDDNQ